MVCTHASKITLMFENVLVPLCRYASASSGNRTLPPTTKPQSLTPPGSTMIPEKDALLSEMKNQGSKSVGPGPKYLGIATPAVDADPASCTQSSQSLSAPLHFPHAVTFPPLYSMLQPSTSKAGSYSLINAATVTLIPVYSSSGKEQN